MNERIKELAEQAGLDIDDSLAVEPEPTYYGTQSDFEKFAELVRAAEREACAKVVEDTLEPWLINEYIVKTTEAIRARGNDLQTAIERGTKAWADVPADWVEDLRGNTPDCKTHPDAPHGFDRNASHSADRYVCDCEFWEPVDAVNMSQDRVDVPGFDEPMWLVDEKGNKQLLPKANRAAPKREWVGLTDEEVKYLISHFDWRAPKEQFVSVIEAKLKEKNA